MSFGGDEPKAEKQLREQSSELVEETKPIRQSVIQSIIAALTQGITPVAGMPIVQRKVSSAQTQAGRRRNALEQSLAEAGLSQSGVGMQAREEIERDLAGSIVGAETSELERLTYLAPEVGYQAAGMGLTGLSRAAGSAAQREQGESAFFGSLLQAIGIAGGAALAGPLGAAGAAGLSGLFRRGPSGISGGGFENVG